MKQVVCRAVLFDLDGVLVDSTPAVARVWSGWANERGFEPEMVVQKAHGRPSITTIRELLPNANHEEENREVERREIEDVEGVIPLTGAMELLRALPAERWTIATSCTRPLACVRIAAAGLPMPGQIVTANDIRHGKPDPEPYIKAAEILGFRTEECIVVEDAPAGICAGKAAGARVIALRTTAGDGELLKAGADWIVKDLGAVQLQPRRDTDLLTLGLLD